MALIRIQVLLVATLFTYSLPGFGTSVTGRNIATELTDANELLAQKKYAGAYQAYFKHAQDNELAQFSLGLMEEYDWGRPADPSAACHWFEKSAAEDIHMAQQMLGNCYQQGIHEKAQYWYIQAADNGLATGNYHLGRMLIEGKLAEPQLRKLLLQTVLSRRFEGKDLSLWRLLACIAVISNKNSTAGNCPFLPDWVRSSYCIFCQIITGLNTALTGIHLSKLCEEFGF
jgi:hypothetical protein